MGTIDPARLLAPVAADRPCGDDLEYDADFFQLEQAAQGKAGSMIGDQVIPAEDPNWKAVRQLAPQLFTRTKDLRIAVLLCRALLHTDGWPGFAAGLTVLEGLLEQFWPGLFPLLDADDNDDPTMRVNTLLGLCGSDTMLRSLREATLVDARVAGRFSLRDVEVAAGRLPPPPDTAPPSADLIRAAFQEVPLADLQATTTAAQLAGDKARAIGRLLDEKLGSRAPDLRPLIHAITSVLTELGRQLEGRGVGGPAVAAAPSAAGAAQVAAPAPGTAPGGSMQIQTREDVIAWLDRMCDFYRRTEPSSPVPILLQRARSLVNKNFLEVIRDLVPDALEQVKTYSGPSEDADNG